MGTLLGWYLNPHRTQFDGGPLEGENCSPVGTANGANATTKGRVNKTGSQMRALLRRSEETDPSSPGWSIPDCVRAAAKLGIALVNYTGRGWAALANALDAGHYVILQGDSDQFSNNTCSGAFNGNHLIGIHPARRVVNGSTQHWIDDGICKVGRWEYDYLKRRYAQDLNLNIRFGVFTGRVPRVAVPAPAPSWGPKYLLTAPPANATFAIQFKPGTYRSYNIDGSYHGPITTAKGFTAYGNSRKKIGTRLFGKMITGPFPGVRIDVHSGNAYWSKPA